MEGARQCGYADKDDSEAPVQVDDETREVKDVKERIEPPPFEVEYSLVPQFMKGESSPDVLKNPTSPNHRRNAGICSRAGI